jgi:hypothetical protein
MSSPSALSFNVRHLLPLTVCLLASGCLFSKRIVSTQYVPEDAPPQASYRMRAPDGTIYGVTLRWQQTTGANASDHIPSSEVTFKIAKPDGGADLDSFTTDVGMLLRNVRLKSEPGQDVLVLMSQQFVSKTPRITEYVLSKSAEGKMTLSRRANFWIESNGQTASVPE